jgi:3-polyprenyl-4-hydroxybenzoate decarboxylase
MKVALGVTGGVAAYKAAELVRRLQQEKLDVQVVMTRAAQEFVTPLTFASLTGKKVITGMSAPDDSAAANVESAIEHIAIALIFCWLRRPPPTFSENSPTESPRIFFPPSTWPRRLPSLLRPR